MTNFVLHITRNSAYRSDCTVSIFIQRTIIRLILCFPFLQCFMDRQVVHLLMQWDDHQTSLDQYYIKICSKWHHLLAHFYIQTTALIVYLTKNWTDLCMPYCSSRANCQICGKHFVLMKVKTVSTSNSLWPFYQSYNQDWWEASSEGSKVCVNAWQPKMGLGPVQVLPCNWSGEFRFQAVSVGSLSF